MIGFVLVSVLVGIPVLVLVSGIAWLVRLAHHSRN